MNELLSFLLPANLAGQESECKLNVLYKQNQMFKGKIMLLYVLTINLVERLLHIYKGKIFAII